MGTLHKIFNGAYELELINKVPKFPVIKPSEQTWKWINEDVSGPKSRWVL